MRFHRGRTVYLLVLLSLGLVRKDALAQVPTGTIAGTVKDSQGLSIARATVTLTNQGTANAQTKTTGSRGGFQFTHLNVGSYQIEVSQPGFKNSIVTNIKLDASTEYSVPPIVLNVGAVTDTVTVEAGSNLVRTAGAELTDTVERAQIEELPIRDRDPMLLVKLQAGVSQNNRAPTAINGQRQSFSSVTLDGINIQDNYIRTFSLDYTPNFLLMSQVGEFTTTTQNAGSQAGLGSSQVSAVTPSGTNSWHGEGFWYYRTDKWGANDWFDNANGIGKPNLLQNQGGGDIGGPIVKNKLFVYGAYELFRRRQEVPANTTVLTSSARSGIFQWRPIVGGSVQSLNLLTHKSVSMDPVITNMLARVPTTINNLSIGDGLNTGGYSLNQRNDDTRDNTSIRLDWNPAAHHSFSGTYAWNRDLQDRGGAGLGLSNTYDAIPSSYNNDRENFLSTAWRWSPSSNFTNEVRLGFDLAPISFLTNQQFGSFTISNTLFNNPDQNSFPSSRKTHTWSWQDNASWSRGNHTLNFGMQVQRITVFAQDFRNSIPDLNLDYTQSTNSNLLNSGDFSGQGGISSADLDTANKLLSTLGGFVGAETQTFNVTGRNSGYVPGAPLAQNFRYNNWSLYAGDSWKWRRNLTFTYGLRWEYNSPMDERDGLLVFPVPSSGQSVQQTLLSDATLDFAGGNSGRRVYGRNLNDFAPNIGIAWDPFGNGKTSIRAGYSINYVNDELIASPYSASVSNPGVTVQTGSSQLNTSISDIDPLRPVIAIPPGSNSFSGDLANLYGGFPGLNFGYAVDPNLRSPYVQQWNLSVQRELGWQTAVTVSYVGNKGTKLYRAIDLNQVNINSTVAGSSDNFLKEFIAARKNGFLALAQPGGSFDPSFNPGIQGSQDLPIFENNLLLGGWLTNPNVQSLIQQGEVGELASFYHFYGTVYQAFTNGPTLQLSPNPLLQAADLLGNYSASTYHAGSVEIRRRFHQGLNVQGSYTFSKVLTDYSADLNADSSRILPYLDNANPRLEWARANFDLTHAFKANFRYELPFGQGHSWAPSRAWLTQLVSGWTMSSIFTWQSGAPFSILSGRGTLNREVFRSETTNTASTMSTPQQIGGQLGIYKQPNGQILLINPTYVGPDGRGAPNDAVACTPLVSGGFCNPDPGTVGNLPRNAFGGPSFFNWDLGILKGFSITESKRLEYRIEMFNAPNHPTFAVGDPLYAAGISGASPSDIYINDSNFGVATSTASSPRVIQMGLRLIF